MKIAYVCADAGVPVFGVKGSSVHVQEMLGAMMQAGADIELFATRFDAALPAALTGVRLHVLPPPPKGPALREAAGLAANAELERLLLTAGPFDLIYERYSLWSHGGLDAAKKLGVPFLLEVNAPLVDEQSEHRVLLRRAEAEAISQRLFCEADAVLAVSEEVAAYARGIAGTAATHIHVLPNGVNTTRFQPVTREERLFFTVGFVGTLKPWHGLSTLIDAFVQLHRRAPQTRLMIVGDGPEREALEAAVCANGLEQAVQFCGAVQPERVPELVNQFDVAVAPYARTEGFYFSPLKVYEYMAAGLPVVVSRVGQLASLIRDGETGVLCEPGDAPALTDALFLLLEEPLTRKRLGLAARACVERDHTWNAVARRVLSLAESLSVRPS
jgi:glycosyltransferase involved in cell wall biosynthesis